MPCLFALQSPLPNQTTFLRDELAVQLGGMGLAATPAITRPNLKQTSMFAPHLDSDDFFSVVLGVSLFVLLGFVRFYRYRRGRPFILLELLGVIAVVSIVIGLLMPRPVSRIPRGYYQGKDQFEWGAKLRSEEKATRQEALTALGEILKQKPPNRSVRSITRDILKWADAREATPLLLELRKSEDAELRQLAEDLHEILGIHPDRGQ